VAGLRSVRPRKCFKNNPTYPFTFSNVLNDGILMTTFIWLFSKTIFVNILISAVTIYTFTIHMNTNNVKYLQVINFSQLTLAKKTEIKRSLRVNNRRNCV